MDHWRTLKGGHRSLGFLPVLVQLCNVHSVQLKPFHKQLIQK